MLLSSSFMLQSSNLQPDSLPPRIRRFVGVRNERKERKGAREEKERRREGDDRFYEL